MTALETARRHGPSSSGVRCNAPHTLAGAMSEEEFLEALSGVDAQLGSHSSWEQIKRVASDHPWSLGETPLSPVQQCVLAFWRIFSLD